MPLQETARATEGKFPRLKLHDLLRVGWEAQPLGFPDPRSLLGSGLVESGSKRLEQVQDWGRPA